MPTLKSPRSDAYSGDDEVDGTGILPVLRAAVDDLNQLNIFVQEIEENYFRLQNVLVTVLRPTGYRERYHSQIEAAVQAIWTAAGFYRKSADDEAYQNDDRLGS